VNKLLNSHSKLSSRQRVVPFLEVILHLGCSANTGYASKNAIPRKLSEETYEKFPRLLIGASALASSGDCVCQLSCGIVKNWLIR
jgi:hypothetical protein